MKRYGKTYLNVITKQWMPKGYDADQYIWNEQHGLCVYYLYRSALADYLVTLGHAMVMGDVPSTQLETTQLETTQLESAICYRCGIVHFTGTCPRVYTETKSDFHDRLYH